MSLPRMRFTVRNSMVAVAVIALVLGLSHWLGRSPASSEYRVVLSEGLILLAAMILAWANRGSRFLFPCGLLLGMAFVAFLHGVYFGVLANDHPGQHTGTLVGFGITFALSLGLPLGAILGAGLTLLRRSRRRQV
jgi:hypothetical protein